VVVHEEVDIVGGFLIDRGTWSFSVSDLYIGSKNLLILRGVENDAEFDGLGPSDILGRLNSVEEAICIGKASDCVVDEEATD
jgi:hypothetical protein